LAEGTEKGSQERVNLRLIEAWAENPKEVLKEAMQKLAVYQASREVEREQKNCEDEGEW
jgi:hypothetical protein